MSGIVKKYTRNGFKMLIITGTGRSGTKTLAEMFRGHHEFRANYILDTYFLKTDLQADPFDSLEKRIQVIMDLHQGIDPGTFIDASNLYIHFIDAVYALNQSVKFIFTVRNGKDFVRSAISRNWHKQRLVGTIPFRNDPYFDMWDTLNPLQRTAWIWNWRNKKALEGFRPVPDRQKLIVKLEQIQSTKVLDSLEMFTDMKLKDRGLSEKQFNANPSFSFPPKEQWTETQNYEFQTIAGEMMQFFGYT
ncbi:MAG: hypothetical protein JSV13_09770 [Nitrospiraceae bacterium]|nr:MAG: hypothetical protein JSV13_09770 [Nitrospiraceae bacterium]